MNHPTDLPATASEGAGTEELPRPRRRDSSRHRFADRHWLSGRLQSAALALTEVTRDSATASLDPSSPEDVRARAAVLDALVQVEHYTRKIATSYGLLVPHRRTHAAQVAEIRRSRRPAPESIDLAARLITDFDTGY